MNTLNQSTTQLHHPTKVKANEPYGWYDSDRMKKVTTLLLGLIVAGYLVILKMPEPTFGEAQRLDEPSVTAKQATTPSTTSLTGLSYSSKVLR